MPRPRNAVRSRKIHVALPEDLIAEFEMRFFDPARDKPMYGVYSTVLGGLLRKWIEDPSILPITIEDIK